MSNTPKRRLDLLTRLRSSLEENKFQEAEPIARQLLTSTYEDETQEAQRSLALSLQGQGRTLAAIFWACAWRSNAPHEEDANSLLNALGSSMKSVHQLELSLLPELKEYADESELGDGLTLALKASPAEHPELMLGAALLSQTCPSREERDSLSFLQALSKSSSSPRVWMAYAFALGALHQKQKAERAYREVLHLLREGASDELEALAAVIEKTRAPSREHVYERLRELYREDYPDLYRVAKEELASGGDSAASRALALACTFTQKHQEAIEQYKTTIKMLKEEGRAPDELLHFNLSGALAKSGARHEALRELQEAASLNDTVARRASEDDHFQSLWDDPYFFMASVAFEEPPSIDDVQKNTRRAMILFYRGDNEEALGIGHLAVAGAALLKDDALLFHALLVHGNISTYVLKPARGIALLSRAVKLAETSPQVAPGDRAEAHHTLGAAYHAAQRFQEAQSRYQAALSIRIENFGEAAPLVAKSYGELARLSHDQQQLKQAQDLSLKAIHLLKESLPNTTIEDEQIEILSDLVLLTSNQVALASEAKEPLEDILAGAEEAIYWLSQLEARGLSLPNGCIEQLRRVLFLCAKKKPEKPLLARLSNIAARLTTLEESNPEDPDEEDLEDELYDDEL